MRKARRTFWITNTISQLCRDRAALLGSKGYDVQFFTSLEPLMAELASKRAHVIIVSSQEAQDAQNDASTEKTLRALMIMPEAQGARLILMPGHVNPALSRLAACAPFRDIIPMRLDDRQWLSRFVFATAGTPLKYVQPAGQITLHNISAAILPARIVWVSGRRLRLESRLRPAVGSSITLRGALAKAMGVETLTLKVVETQRSHLLYRFSDAIVAEWSAPSNTTSQNAASAPSTESSRIDQVLARLKQVSTGPRCRVFVAAQNNELRQQVIGHFEDPRFDVSTALHKLSIVEEPRYFSPDVVLIEDGLCRDEGRPRFEQMLAALAPEATIIIIGTLTDFADLKRKFPKKRLVQLARLPQDLSLSILARYLPAQTMRAQAADKDAQYIPAEHHLSQAEVSVPARLSRIHPAAVQIALPTPVANFALLRLESPLLHRSLGRDPYIKITETLQNTHPDESNFIYLAEGYLADVDKTDRQKLAADLTKLVAENFSRSDGSEGLGGHKLDGTRQRTPEFGSLRQTAPAVGPAVGPSNTVLGSAASAGPVIGEIIVEDAAVIIPELHEDTPAPSITPASDTDSTAAQRTRKLRGDTIIYSKRSPDTATPIKHPKKQPQGQQLVQALGYLAVVGLLIGMFWAFIAFVAPNWQRSGGIYSDQLQKFAPQTNTPASTTPE